MRLDLTQAMTRLVETPEAAPLDAALLLEEGKQRVRRRQRLVAAGCAAVAVAAVGLTAWVVRPDPAPPQPAERIVPDTGRRLALDDSGDPLDSTEVVRLRDLNRQPATNLDFDRYQGLTDDGLVLRARYSYDGDVWEAGLLDPASQRTDWLPDPGVDVGEPTPFEATADRLVYLDNRQSQTFRLLVFDRAARAWQIVSLDRPVGVDRFFGMPNAFTGPLAGADGRVYLQDPVSTVWYAASIGGGEELTPVPGLDGELLAWGGQTRATADRRGLVTLSEGGDSRVVATEPPEGCQQPVQAAFAGPRLLVSYACGGDLELWVFAGDGTPELAVAGDEFYVAAASDRYAVLAARGHTHLVDLVAGTVQVLGPMLGNDPVADVVDDLVLTGRQGPADDRDTIDEIYSVDRLPR